MTTKGDRHATSDDTSFADQDLTRSSPSSFSFSSDRISNDADIVAEPSTTERVRTPTDFNLRNIKQKNIPSNCILISAALNRLGALAFPKQWGIAQCWDQMPFRKCRGGDGYYRLTIKGREQGQKLAYQRIDSRASLRDLRTCARLYRLICRRFLFAVEKGKVECFVLWDNRGRIKNVPEGFWYNQNSEIFYTGSVIHHRKGYGRIIVHRSSFTQWLSARRDRDIMRSIVGVVKKWEKQHKVMMRKDELYSTISAVLKRIGRKSDKRIIDRVWAQLPGSKGGHPQAAFPQKFAKHRGELQTAIEQELTRAPMV